MRAQRALLPLLAFALLAAPLTASAQQAGRVPRIGFLSWAGPGGQALADAFLQGLHERGYVKGRSLTVEYRDGTMNRLPDLAAELVRLNVDAIVAFGTPAALAAKQTTSTIPIVMTVVADPVGSGLVAGLARPGGNVTGPSMSTPEVFPKELELLKEAVPSVSRVAVLMDPTNPSHVPLSNELEVAAKVLRMKVQRIDVRTGTDLDGAFAAASRERADALFVFPLRVASPDSRRILEFAVKSRMPTLTLNKEGVKAGGLMSYGPNFRDHLRHAGIYLDKILKGAKPADLPVEQPTKFELVINLKTAKALGLTIPRSLLSIADEVIQ